VGSRRLGEDGVILVTGASGRLGQWVVADLTARGESVLCLSRRPLDAPTIAGLSWPGSVETVACDLTDPASVAHAQSRFTDVTALVHLAAYVPDDTAIVSAADAVATLHANVNATARLLGALERASGLGAIVMSSTFEVYGPPKRLPVTEADPTRPASHYGASKLLTEKCLALFTAERGVPACSLRMPAIYGPGDTIRRALGNFVRAAAEGGELRVAGDGGDLRELLYLGDAAEAVARALAVRADGAFNVASGVGYSIRQMAETVVRVAGSGSITTTERTKERADYVMSIERAATTLGWQPRTRLDDGIAAMLAWARG
jgi:nucleoside-diphosphate-sugar epimerase